MSDNFKAPDVEMKNLPLVSPDEYKPHSMVTLKLLGDGQNCQVEDCGRPAYLVCGESELLNG